MVSMDSFRVFHSQRLLTKRRLSLDPQAQLPTFKRSIYSLSSSVKRLNLEKKLESHDGCVNCISFSHCGHLLASGSDDLHIVLWDWAKRAVVSKFDSKHVANVFQAKFMPLTNDSVIVSAARDGQVRCHVTSTTGELVDSKRVAHHNDSAHKLALEPDNPHVFLSCGEDGNVLQIDLRENGSQRNKILACRSDMNARVPLYSIFIDPSNYNRFAISGRDQYARVYDRRVLNEERDPESPYPDPVQKFCPHHLEHPDNEFKKANVTCLVYSHDGKELLCSYNDDDIYTFDATQSSGTEYTKHFEGHRNNATVKGVNYFGLGSEYVVSGSDCGHVFLWDKQTQNIVQYFEGDNEGVVNCLEPHPHMPILAVSGLDHDIKIFSPSADKITDLEGLSEITSTNIERRKVASDYTPDGYDMILNFIMRQYRRGLRHRAGIDDDDSDQSSTIESDYDLPSMEDEDEDDEDAVEGGEREGRDRRRIRRRRRDEEEEDSDEDFDNDSRVVRCVQS